MAKILKMPDITERAAATTAPQDVLAEDAATFDVLRRMREDILCCVLKPDQRLRFGELRQRGKKRSTQLPEWLFPSCGASRL